MFNGFADINMVISCFAFLGGFAQLIFFFNFIYSALKGPKAPKNPWGSATLEWTAPVEHLHGNWPGEIPTVHRWAYDYSLPGKEEDFIPQDVPYSEAELKEMENQKH
jgi:cytochrome c oxidase subunit 1